MEYLDSPTNNQRVKSKLPKANDAYTSLSKNVCTVIIANTSGGWPICILTANVWKCI